jgi:cell division protein FtsQ
MNTWKRYLRYAGMLLGSAIILLALGFVERTALRTPLNDLRVTVSGADGVRFIDEAAIRREVLEQGIAVMGTTLGEVDETGIEDRLRSIPCVARAEAYHTMDGVLHVNVVQRTPIVRVINADGVGFYIDEEGWTMPTELAHPARVLVVTGALDEPGVRDGALDVLGSDSLRARYLSDDIHRIANYLRSEPLWEALFDQLVVRDDGLFELVPKVGGQRIVIGDGTDLQQRFAKLRIFYAKGMPMSDWRRYERIDLRFADQVVCTQRSTP